MSWVLRMLTFPNCKPSSIHFSVFWLKSTIISHFLQIGSHFFCLEYRRSVHVFLQFLLFHIICNFSQNSQLNLSLKVFYERISTFFEVHHNSQEGQQASTKIIGWSGVLLASTSVKLPQTCFRVLYNRHRGHTHTLYIFHVTLEIQHRLKLMLACEKSP